MFPITCRPYPALSGCADPLHIPPPPVQTITHIWCCSFEKNTHIYNWVCTSTKLCRKVDLLEFFTLLLALCHGWEVQDLICLASCRLVCVCVCMCVCVCVSVCVCACGCGCGCGWVHTTPITAIYTYSLQDVPNISNLAPLNHGTREEEGEES